MGVKPQASMSQADVLVEVDVEPFSQPAARAASASGRHQAGAHPPMPGVPRHHEVLDPGMASPIPDHVHEARQGAVSPGRHPPQAVPLHQALPVVGGG